MTIKLTNQHGQTMHVHAPHDTGQDLPVFLAMKLGPCGVTVDVLIDPTTGKYGLTSGRRMKEPERPRTPLGDILFNLGIGANKRVPDA